MPQMMPLNWLSLMFLFVMIFYCFSNMNYFNFLSLSKKEEIKKSPMIFNWKW
uniref:ATP synthase complex subunit 8 n=1 Tax=Chaetocnema pelagica TaxID=1425542 RepID=A0A3G1GRR7_9CUCU|nr:ATP synthase F0 subunit 8 [Chaetocnema pelagica]